MNKKAIKVCLFIRVSTDKQEYQRQALELNEYCNAKGYIVARTIATKISGVKRYDERPDLQELFEAAKKGEFNTVLVTEISRIGRNAKDIRSAIDYLHSKKISIVFKNLGGLESLDDIGQESFVTNIIIAIYSELAQEEKRILSERIKSGLVNARAKGKQIGRPDGSTIGKQQLLKKYSRLAADLRNGMTLNAAKAVHKVSKGTVIKIKRLVNI